MTRDVATILEALPYIREFHGRTIVIKYGGAAMTDPALVEDFARDVVLLKYVGMNPIVVHGGGPDITRYMEKLGMEVEFVDGLRVTDAATAELAKMVLVGKQNKEIVLRLARHGQPAVGLCGDDGRLFGSVTAQDIADAIKEARGIKVDKRKIKLEEPIRSIGTHMVDVEVAEGVHATVKTMVVEQK